jgi:hypothetical protein
MLQSAVGSHQRSARQCPQHARSDVRASTAMRMQARLVMGRRARLAVQGELNGRDPMEEMRAVFAALSRSDGKDEQEALITHTKLQAACREFEVRRQHACTNPPR